MAESKEGQFACRFGQFRLDLRQRALFRGTDLVPLTPKAFETLAALACRPGEVISKTELMTLVWPDTFVEENNLTQSISALRKALGADLAIETIPRRGYRLIVPAKAKPAATKEEDERASVPAPPDGSPTRLRRRNVVAALASLLVCVFVAALFALNAYRSRAAVIESLVVLPFVNLSEDPNNDYFADGLTEELTNDLARVQGLRVVARTTAFQFKGKARDIREIGQRLGVRTALEGSVRRQGGRIRVTAQLNNVANGYHLWSQTYDTDASDVFSVQEDIALRIADTLQRHLPGGAAPRRKPTENVEAHTLYLEGLHLRNTTDASSVRKAIQRFQQALGKDPNYAAPYAGLADCYSILAFGEAMPAREAFPLAKAAADRALSLDDTLASAHTSKAIVELLFDWDWKAAGREFRRAVELNPSDAQAFHWYSHYSAVMDRLGDSLAQSRRALELDPLDLLVSVHIGWHYLHARQYADAVAASEKTLDLDPHSNVTLRQLADAYEHLDQYEKAIATIRRIDGGEGLASRLERGWQAGAARGYWEASLEAERSRQPAEDYELARCFARLGKTQEALDSLERAYAQHTPRLIYIKRERYFDALSTDARFRKLSKAIGLD